MQHRHRAQRCEARRNIHAAQRMQTFHQRELIRSVRILAQCMKHARTELIRAGRREHDHRAFVPRFAPIGFRRTIGNRRMRVEGVVCLLVDGTDLRLRHHIASECRPEILTERRQKCACIIQPLLCKCPHPCGDLRRILRQMIEQPLQIA